MNSRIQDGPTAGTSYSVDLPYGGVATIENNVIEKRPNSPDDAFIHYGGDGPTVPNSSLTISGNTVIDDRASGQGPFVFDGAVLTSGGPIVMPAISGNTFYGPGPDNLLARPGFFDVQPGTPYVSINNFLSITNAPTLDTSPPSTIPFVPPSVPSAIEGNATIDGSTGSRTEFLDFAPGVVSIFGSVTIGAFGNQLTVINNGNGQNTVDLVNSTVSASGAGTVGGVTTVNGLEQDVVWLEGSSSVATTVNASGSGTTGAVPGAFQPELWAVANGGSGVVNGGAQAILPSPRAMAS
jgi:hypothetical protein